MRKNNIILNDFLIVYNKYKEMMAEVRECESYEWALDEMYEDTKEKYTEALEMLERACETLKKS